MPGFGVIPIYDETLYVRRYVYILVPTCYPNAPNIHCVLCDILYVFMVRLIGRELQCTRGGRVYRRAKNYTCDHIAQRLYNFDGGKRIISKEIVGTDRTAVRVSIYILYIKIYPWTYVSDNILYIYMYTGHSV